MRAGILFDADNTLWDTDSVFRNAQLSLLHVLAEAGLSVDPDVELEVLRSIDMALAHRFGRFEYDFARLAEAIYVYYTQHLSRREIVEQVACGSILSELDRELISKASQVYQEALRRVPTILPDTIEVLSVLHGTRRCGIPLVSAVLSEGDPERLESVFRAHHLKIRGLFDEIIVGHKSRLAFEHARSAMNDLLPTGNDETLFVIVGDTLTRDVKFGNQAGFVTVYKPSPFRGIEVPAQPDEEADYTISRLAELLPILDRLGVVLATERELAALEPEVTSRSHIVVKQLDQ